MPEALNTTVPIAPASDCATAITAAKDALTLSVELGCEALCEGELKPQMQTPSCSVVVPEKEWLVTLKWECGDDTEADTGIIKLCKVAGPGVTVGAPFTFNAGSSPVTVPAGPPPAGTCVIGPTLPVGTTVSVFETIPPGHNLSSIDVAPPGRVVGTPNLPGGSVDVTIGSGVTEVTFTDDGTGCLEICNKGDVKGSFSFTVNPGGKGPFSSSRRGRARRPSRSSPARSSSANCRPPAPLWSAAIPSRRPTSSLATRRSGPRR